LDFLRRHVEKLILGVALVALLASIVLLLRSLGSTRVRVSEAVGAARSAASGGADIAIDEPIGAELYPRINDPRARFDTLPGPEAPPLRGSLYEPADYIICYSESCNKLIPIGLDKCPFCKTEQPPRDKDTKDSDRDGDGIPNHIEQKYAFLNPDNPRDAQQDQDQDGFLNGEEFARGTDMQSAASTPPLGVLLRVDRLVERPLPIMLMKIARNNSDDSAAWTITMQVDDVAKKRKSTKLTSVGKSLEGFAIRSAAFEPDPQKEGRQLGVVVVAPEAGGEPYTLHEKVPVNEREKFVRLGFLASRDPQFLNRGGVRFYVQKAGDTLPLKHGKDPKDPTKPREETYRIESVAEGKVEVVRTEPAPAEGEAPVRITVPTFNARTDLAVPAGGGMMGPGGAMDGAGMPGMEGSGMNPAGMPAMAPAIP